MVAITDIRETKRGRFALFSHEEFLFSVDGETLHQYAIQVGSSMSEGELSSLREASDTRKAKDQALRFLSRRAHGERELYDKLCRTHDEYSAAAAVASMVELGLLNDRQFAMERVEALAYKDKSRFEMRNSLMIQGIDKDLAEEMVDELGVADREILLRVIQKKYQEKLNAGKKEAVIAALARRGFAQRDIFSALDEALTEQEDE